MRYLKDYPWREVSGLALGAALSIAAAPAADAQTLRDALTNVYLMNPKLLAERAQLRATDETYAQAVANWRPTIQASGSGGLSSDQVTGGTPSQDQVLSSQFPRRSYGVSISQPLYRGGRTVAQTEQALNTVLAERATLVATEGDVLLQAATDYLDVVRDQATVELNVHNEQTLLTQLEAVRARNAGGAASLADIAATEAAYNGAIAQRLQAEMKLQVSRSNFIRDIGLTPGALAFPADLIAPPLSREEAVNVAMEENPKVQAALYSQRAADANVRVVFGQALPSASLVGTVRHQDDTTFIGEHENIESIIFQITVPIYSGGQIESQTRAAQQVTGQRRQQAETAREQAKSDAESTWTRLEAALAATSAYQAAIRANEISLTGVQQQQLAGERTILDVLNVEQNLLQANVNMIQNRHDEIVARFGLAAAIGKMTARDLGLDVELYDPEKNFKAVKDRWFGFGIPE